MENEAKKQMAHDCPLQPQTYGLHRYNNKKRREKYRKLFKINQSTIWRENIMTITVKSKIEKGLIRLPKKVCIPHGTPVIVRIDPILKTKDKQKVISALSGAWSDDPTIMPIFKELEQERHSYFGREVSFE